MIITKVPLRVSIAGGGTDLPGYYLNRDHGEVINFPINKHIYINSSLFHNENKTNFKYSEVETVENFEDFKNPIVREVLKYFSADHGIQYSSMSSVPGGTGLGSSSAFCVGLVSNLSKRLGREISQFEAANIACKIELEILKEPIGKQDQFGCAIGGVKHLKFFENKVLNEPILLDSHIENEFMKKMLLVRVGAVRSASKILSNIQKKPSINYKILDEIRMLLPGIKDALISGDIQFIGESLNENWKMKKSLDKNITDLEIDSVYDEFVPDLAYGGKLLGAGGSGFILFILKDYIENTKVSSKLNFSGINIDKKGVISTSL